MTLRLPDILRHFHQVRHPSDLDMTSQDPDHSKPSLVRSFSIVKTYEYGIVQNSLQVFF